MIKEKLKIHLNDKNKRNFIIYGIGQSFNLVTPLAITPFIIAKCGSDGLGKVGLGFALALFLILIVDYAFEVKGVKQVAENSTNKNNLSKLFSLGITTKFTLFIFSSCFTLLLINTILFFKEEKALYFISVSIVFAQVFNPIWILQGLQDFLALSIINILSKIIYVIMVLVFICSKSDYIYVNLYLGISNFTIYVLGLLYLTKKHQIQYNIPSKRNIFNVIKSDFTFCISQLLLSTRQLSPLLLTSYFLGYSVGGQYRIIEQFITLFRTFIQVFLRFFYPETCKRYLNNSISGINYWKKVIKINFVIVFVLLGVIFCFSESILLYFNIEGSTLTVLNNLLRFALIVPFLMAFSLPLEQIILVSGKNKYYIRTTFFVTAINVILIYLLIQTFELNGVLSSLIIAEVLFILLYYQCFKTTNHKNII
jgi:O-antigen/teichoic acid export membrane protein